MEVFAGSAFGIALAEGLLGALRLSDAFLFGSILSLYCRLGSRDSTLNEDSTHYVVAPKRIGPLCAVDMGTNPQSQAISKDTRRANTPIARISVITLQEHRWMNPLFHISCTGNGLYPHSQFQSCFHRPFPCRPGRRSAAKLHFVDFSPIARANLRLLAPQKRLGGGLSLSSELRVLVLLLVR